MISCFSSLNGKKYLTTDLVNMELKEIQKLLREEYIQNGYMDMWCVDLYQTDLPTQTQRIYDIAEVGLWNTEVSETLEDTRKIEDNQKLRNKWGEEGADVIIRVLNFFSRKEIEAEEAILNKHRKNLGRGKLHGNKV